MLYRSVDKLRKRYAYKKIVVQCELFDGLHLAFKITCHSKMIDRPESLGSELSFDEDDEYFMTEISDKVALIVPEIFPSKIKVASTGEDCQLHCAPIHKLPKERLVQFLDLVETNLKTLYVKYNGLNWKLEKLEEMKEAGLVYLWYTDSKGELLGFISFMLTHSDQYKVLYLYEIHVSPEYHSMKIGTQLIDKLHELSHHLNAISFKQQKYLHFRNEGTSLTVFSENVKALQWYHRLGYQLTIDSPTDKTLRNKIVKPDYYLLIRFNDSTSLSEDVWL